MKTTPFWTDDFPRPSDLPLAEELPERVDVAIIGSGYTGLSAALVLAKSGASVAVLERETMGWGASSRNGGMTMPGLKQGMPQVIDKYGPEIGRTLWQASIDAIYLIDRLVKEEQIDCHWQIDGYMALAAKPSHFENMKKKKAWFADQLGYTDLRLVSPNEIRSEIGTAAYYGGLVGELGAGLHPAKYVFGLARAAARRGIHLCEHAGVTALEKQNGAFRLNTARGPLFAAEVVLATNGYTDRLVPACKPKLFPVGSYPIVTEPLSPELQEKLSPRGRMFYDSKWLLSYFRLTPDGRMLWGGRNNLNTDLDLKESARILRRQMVDAFPELVEIPITHSWTGKLGITFDLLPHIGRAQGVHYVFGYGGHGLSLATYLGAEMGKLLTGELASSPFAEIPHQTMFFYRNEPWFLPFAAWYYRFLDWRS
ncbi:MAG: NAD(P)/FAD-dependent oxidoreductase [Candidatus Promineifilaceae bacterium]